MTNPINNNSLHNPFFQTTKMAKIENPQGGRVILFPLEKNLENAATLATGILADLSQQKLKNDAASSLISLENEEPPKKSINSKRQEKSARNYYLPPTQDLRRAIFRKEKSDKFPLWKTVKKHLDNGADINIQSQQKINGKPTLDTPLHRACQLKLTDIVAKFLARGADPTIKNTEGHIPSQKTNDPKIQKVFERYKALKDNHQPINDLENDPIVKGLITSKSK